MRNFLLNFFVKAACTRWRWHLTTVTTRARLWPRARRSSFVAFLFLHMQGFWEIFCIPTFIKLLYFLPKHCQRSLAICVDSEHGVRILLLCVTSDEAYLYCMCLLVVVLGGLGVAFIQSLLWSLHTFQGLVLLPSHPAVCGVWCLLLFQGNGIFSVFIHLFYIYMLSFCASWLPQPVRVQCSSTLIHCG